MSIDIHSRVITAGHITQNSTLVIPSNILTGKALAHDSEMNAGELVSVTYSLIPSYTPNIKTRDHEIVHPKSVTYSIIR